MAEENHIDPNRLLERCLGNADLARQLLALFRQHVPPVVQRLKTAAVQHNWDEAARSAHRLKGSLANLCAEGLVGLAVRSEEVAKRQDANGLLQAVTEMESAIANCLDRLDQLITSLPR